METIVARLAYEIMGKPNEFFHWVRIFKILFVSEIRPKRVHVVFLQLLFVKVSIQNFNIYSMEKLVFIIDDDPVYLNFMKSHFMQMDEFKTQVFQNGSDAIKELDSVKPYLIILDHQFLNDPTKTGLEFLKEIRKKDSGIPVIYITASDEESLIAKTKKLKVTDHILKDEGFLVHLRTALDKLTMNSEKGGLFKNLFKK